MRHNTTDYTRQVSQEFGAHADDYDDHSGLQEKVASELITYCPNFKEYQSVRILEIGCGTGHFTQRLLDKYPNAECIITDISPDMLDVCRVKCGEGENIVHHVMNGENITPELGKFDLIVSSMAVQWFQTPTASVEKLAMQLRDGGVLALSTLADGYWPEWRGSLRKNNVSSTLIVPPRLPDEMSVDRHIFIERYNSSLDFLRRLEKTGASTPVSDAPELTVKELRPVMRTHNNDFDSQITWHIAIGHWQP